MRGAGMKAWIYPLEKIVLDDVSIAFGMTKKEVERLLGFATSIGEWHYYFGAELAISYDKHENGHSYQFMNLSIGIYREMTPRDVEEMIAEMKAHGIPTEQNPDLEADKEKALHLATVGAGVFGYYQR